MTLPWLLLLYRTDERSKLEAHKSALFAAGLGASAPSGGAEQWGAKLNDIDRHIARLLRPHG